MPHDRPQNAVHPQFPLECRCADRREERQLSFAARVLDLLPHRADLAYEARDDGLLIFGETELAIERPLGILKEAYGQFLHVDPVAIRYRIGKVIEEPHMSVRVLCASRHFDSLKQDLLLRGARIQDEELRPPVGVIRATAPLRQLMGYSQWLEQHTSGNARDVMWLSHYAPREQRPPDTVRAGISARHDST